MRAVILSGSGRYADPWHRYDETSAALAGIIAGVGYRVDVSDDLLGGLAALATAMETNSAMNTLQLFMYGITSGTFKIGPHLS